MNGLNGTNSTPRPTLGRTVHYVLTSGPRLGEHRMAHITNSPSPGRAPNLAVLMEPDDLAGQYRGEPRWMFLESVPFAADARMGTWHWPEKE
jgi:hypothetical protein